VKPDVVAAPKPGGSMQRTIGWGLLGVSGVAALVGTIEGISTFSSPCHSGKACTPDRPIGACMVSSEGSCAAYYKYQANG
jgi:hypothetical protein